MNAAILRSTALLVALSSTPALAADVPAPPAAPAPTPTPGPSTEARSDLGFLEVGRSYLIKFPEERHPVLRRESQVISEGFPVTTTSANGEVINSGRTGPVTWNMKYQVDVFIVRKLGGGSWALLEHPADPKAALEVLSARRRIADKKAVAELEKTDEGRKQLAKLREDAGSELKMTLTWVNLLHAVAISDPPPDSDQDWKLNVNVQVGPGSPR